MSSNLFSKRLRHFRGTRKKADFARFLGLSAPAYQRYEDGRIPRSDCLLAISKTLGTSISYLLGHSDDPAPDPREVGVQVLRSWQTGPEATPMTCDAAPVYRSDAPPAAASPPCPGCVAKDAEISYLRGVVADQAAALRAVSQRQNKE